ncbi:hypothetical protein ACFX1R_042542 [Malus domestica]
MGAICYLEKTGLPLHQGSNQNDDRRVQTFSKVLKKEEVGQIKTLEVQGGSFYKRKFKCALKRTACLYKKKSALDGISEIEEVSSKIENADSKIEEASSEIGEASCFSRRVSTRHTQTQLCGNHGQFVKAPIPGIEEAPVFFSLVSTCHAQTQLCENHGQFIEAPIPDIEEAPVSSASSTPITCTLSLTKITDDCRRFLIKKKAREGILINHALVADTSRRIVPLQVLKKFL